MSSREEGLRGEETAIKTLKRRGYKIVERNHRNRLGEIDVIAEEGRLSRFCGGKKEEHAVLWRGGLLHR